MSIRGLPRGSSLFFKGLVVAAGCSGGVVYYRNIHRSIAHAESTVPPATSASYGRHLRLISSEIVNHNTKRLRFELPQAESNSGLALTSSLLTISWPKGSWFPVPRPYTPVNPLDAQGFIDLLVKKYPNGKSSTHLHSLQPGDSLFFAFKLSGYTWKPNKFPHILLIAGGAGITPVYQLAQGILSNPEDKTRITLVFGVNGDEDVLLKEEFQSYERRFPDRFKAIYTVSNPGEGSAYRTGRVTKALLEEVLESAGKSPQDEKPPVFLCGPPPMEESLVGKRGSQPGILQELGYEKDQIVQF